MANFVFSGHYYQNMEIQVQTTIFFQKCCSTLNFIITLLICFERALDHRPTLFQTQFLTNLLILQSKRGRWNSEFCGIFVVFQIAFYGSTPETSFFSLQLLNMMTTKKYYGDFWKVEKFQNGGLFCPIFLKKHLMTLMRKYGNSGSDTQYFLQILCISKFS